MPAKYTHDIVATVGKYTDRQTGEEKKQYLTVGKGFTDEQGRQSLKLNALPVGPEWSGWVSLYPAKTKQDAPQGDRPQQRSAPPEPTSNDHDDIPF